MAHKPGLVTFTFDDGISENTAMLIDALLKQGIKATFFIVGNTLRTKNHENALKYIVEKGHFVGNHTWSHPNLKNLSVEKIKDELTETEEKIKSIIGRVSCKYMRPPFGEINDTVRGAVAELGYTPVLWNVDSRDWNFDISKQDMLNYYHKTFDKADKNKDRFIILQHDRRKATVELIPDIAEMVRDKGFKIVPLDEYLAEV